MIKFNQYILIKIETVESIPEFSIFFARTTHERWPIMLDIGKRSSNYAVVLHKDEYCEFDVSDFSSAAVKYRGYYDENLLSDSVKFFPLGVRKVFPVIYPREIVPASERFLFFFLFSFFFSFLFFFSFFSFFSFF